MPPPEDTDIAWIGALNVNPAGSVTPFILSAVEYCAVIPEIVVADTARNEL